MECVERKAKVLAMARAVQIVTQAGFRSRRIRHIRNTGRYIHAPKRLAKTFNAASGVLQASKKGGYALLNRGPHHYEHGNAN
jgi:hypothetical protein